MELAPAIGIALGVTTASVAVCKHGEVEMIPIDNGNLTMPCMVAFKPDSSCLVGDAAKDYMGRGELNYQNTIYDIGKMLGQKYIFIHDLVEGWPFDVKNESGNIKIKVPNRCQLLTPEELCVVLFRKLRESAEAYLELEAVTDAVICVPAYYNQIQRTSVINAGKEAGLNVLKVIDQNIAVDRVYEVRAKSVRNIAIVKVGGAATCITLIDNQNGGYKQIKQIMTEIGGNNFDEELLRFCTSDFQEKFEVDLTEGDHAVICLRSACEEAKRSLSKSAAGYILVDNFYERIDYSAIITRQKLEERCSDHFKFIKKFTEDELKAGKFNGSSEGNDAFIIGGSVKVPKLKGDLEEILCCHHHDIDPQYVEVHGAAKEASLVCGRIFCSVYDDETLSSICIKTEGRKIEVLIPRGEKLPVTKTWPSSGSLQGAVTFQLVEDGNTLKEYNLDKVSEGSVTIRIEKNGLLDVTF